jgi:hypothetical protein
LIGSTSDAAKSRVKSEAQARAADLRDAAMDAMDTAKESTVDATSAAQSRLQSSQETTGGPRSDDDV